MFVTLDKKLLGKPRPPRKVTKRTKKRVPAKGRR